MRKLKILFQCPRYLPDLGGIQISTHNLAKELIRKGHQVSVLCGKTSPKLNDFEILDKIRIYRFPTPKLGKFLSSLNFILLQKKLKRFLTNFFKENQFDIIISRFLFFVKPTKETTNTPIAYLQPSIGYLAQMRSAENTKLKGKPGRYLKALIAYKLEKKALNKADFILTRSNSMSFINQKIFKIRKNKIRFFRQGIDLNKFKKRKRKVKLKHKKIILTVSRLSPDKNNSSLINAIAKLKNKNAILVIVGGGLDLRNLKKLVKKLKLEKRILFVGEQKNVKKFYDSSDIFVLSSKQEGFPNVFVEAAASCLPIVAFKANPPKINIPSEFISKNKIGFAVKDEAEIAEKIDLLLEDNNLREKLGKAARKQAEKYSWKKTAENFLKEINKIILKKLR